MTDREDWRVREALTPTETRITADGPCKGEIRRDHPAFGMIGASRWVGGGHDLFGSPIKHRAGVTITLVEAYEQGDEYSWRQFGTKIVAQVHVSEAQWASFVTAMNVRDGVPCTISYRQDGKLLKVPSIQDDHPIERRRKMIEEKVRKDMARMREFVTEYDKLLNATGPVSKTRMKELRTLLLHAVDYAPGAYQFAADQVSEHMENTVTAAKAEVEGFVLHQALKFPGLANAAPEIPKLSPPKESP